MLVCRCFVLSRVVIVLLLLSLPHNIISRSNSPFQDNLLVAHPPPQSRSLYDEPQLRLPAGNLRQHGPALQSQQHEDLERNAGVIADSWLCPSSNDQQQPQCPPQQDWFILDHLFFWWLLVCSIVRRRTKAAGTRLSTWTIRCDLCSVSLSISH